MAFALVLEKEGLAKDLMHGSWKKSLLFVDDHRHAFLAVLGL